MHFPAHDVVAQRCFFRNVVPLRKLLASGPTRLPDGAHRLNNMPLPASSNEPLQCIAHFGALSCALLSAQQFTLRHAEQPSLLSCAVAHVKNEETQEWWRFDDETTASMKHGPVGEAGDHGVQATVTAAGKVRGVVSPPAAVMYW